MTDTTNFCPLCETYSRDNIALRAEVQSLKEKHDGTLRANQYLLNDIKNCNNGDCAELQKLRAEVQALRDENRGLKLEALSHRKQSLEFEQYSPFADTATYQREADEIARLEAELKEQAQ